MKKMILAGLIAALPLFALAADFNVNVGGDRAQRSDERAVGTSRQDARKSDVRRERDAHNRRHEARDDRRDGDRRRDDRRHEARNDRQDGKRPQGVPHQDKKGFCPPGQAKKGNC